MLSRLKHVFIAPKSQLCMRYRPYTPCKCLGICHFSKQVVDFGRVVEDELKHRDFHPPVGSQFIVKRRPCREYQLLVLRHCHQGIHVNILLSHKLVNNSQESGTVGLTGGINGFTDSFDHMLHFFQAVPTVPGSSELPYKIAGLYCKITIPGIAIGIRTSPPVPGFG